MEDYQKTEYIKGEVVECEFVGVDSQDVHQLCTACLCATRTTRTLDDGALKQYYMHILTEMQPEGGVVVLQSPRVCWECASHLKRAVRFREQVQDSYRLLQPMILKPDSEHPEEFAQSAVCHPERLRTCFAYSIHLSPQDDDAQLITITKREDDNDDDVKYDVRVAENDDRTNKQLDETYTHISNEVLNDMNTMNTPTSTDKSCGDVNFGCGYCHKRFTSKVTLECHIATHSKTNDKSYPCEMCNKILGCKSALVNHNRTHTGEKPYRCEMCQKSFTQKGNLINHLRTHTAKKLFQCEECPKSFVQKQYLTSHKRFHSGEKPFQCEVCPRSFSHKQSLVAHTRTHTGERPFQCEVCGKSYSNKRDFVSHIGAHAGETSREKLKKSSRNVTPEVRSHIITLHQSGRNISSIADEMGMTRITVRRWIRRYKEEGHVQAAQRPPQQPRLISGRRLQEMLAAYRDQPTTPTRQFAERFHCSTQCVRDALHRAGVRYNSDSQTSSWELNVPRPAHHADQTVRGAVPL